MSQVESDMDSLALPRFVTLTNPYRPFLPLKNTVRPLPGSLG